MTKEILVRLLRGLATILIVATVVFIIVRLTGDPVRSVLPDGTAPEIEQQYRERWGLDRSLPEQYLTYLLGIFRGDFGRSYFDADSALNVVLSRIPATLALTVPSFIVATAAGLLFGIIAALRRGGALDRFITTTSVIFGAVPSFVLGVILVLVFSVSLGWLPSAGNSTPAHIVLPLVTMAVASGASLARMTRASMADALAMPSMEHAKSLGISPIKRVLGYALPNAMLPLITVIGFELAYLLAGSSVIEVLFSWPGIGRLFVQAADRNDFAVVQAVVILITVSVVIVNALIDISYRVLDPRLRKSRA